MVQDNSKVKLKVCYILSYKSPSYIRTTVLLNAIKKIPRYEIHTAINANTKLLRYIDTLWRLLCLRLRVNPDVYILGFRGQEIYWPVRLITAYKPLIFDEFIIMDDWLGRENRKLPKSLLKLAKNYEKSVLESCTRILADTELDARKSSQVYGIPLNKYKVIYVGTDEDTFKPIKDSKKGKGENLHVFFYGTMAPLHGLKYILQTAQKMKNEPVHFTIVGGKNTDSVEFVTSFLRKNGLSNVTFKEWINYNELPLYIAASDIFLGGPFGNTSQSKRVITGKTYQALAMAVPVVVGRIEEEVGFIDKKNCMIVEQGSSEAIVSVLRWAYSNRGTLESVGQKGKELYNCKFSSTEIIKNIKEVIDDASKVNIP